MKPSKHGRETKGEGRGGKNTRNPPNSKPFCLLGSLLLHKTNHNPPRAPRAGNAQKRRDSWKQAPFVPGLAQAYLFILEEHNNNHHIFSLSWVGFFLGL